MGRILVYPHQITSTTSLCAYLGAHTHTLYTSKYMNRLLAPKTNSKEGLSLRLIIFARVNTPGDHSRYNNTAQIVWPEIHLHSRVCTPVPREVSLSSVGSSHPLPSITSSSSSSSRNSTIINLIEPQGDTTICISLDPIHRFDSKSRTSPPSVLPKQLLWDDWTLEQWVESIKLFTADALTTASAKHRILRPLFLLSSTPLVTFAFVETPSTADIHHSA
jgi:hypothetical protein